jgi:hypothetical protein
MFVKVLTELWHFSLPSTKFIHSSHLYSGFFKIRFNIILQSIPVSVARLLAGCWRWREGFEEANFQDEMHCEGTTICYLSVSGTPTLVEAMNVLLTG